MLAEDNRSLTDFADVSSSLPSQCPFWNIKKVNLIFRFKLCGSICVCTRVGKDLELASKLHIFSWFWGFFFLRGSNAM